jgi:hypothetical protein
MSSFDQYLSDKKRKYHVTICGNGNEAHVMAAHAASLPNTVTSIFKIKHTHDGMISTNLYNITAKHRDGRPDINGEDVHISNCPDTVIATADFIFVCVPTSVMEMYLECIAPYVQRGAMVGMIAQTGIVDYLARCIFKEKLDMLVLFYLLDMPWACRITEFGRYVDVLGTKSVVDMHVDPATEREHVAAVFTDLFGVPEDMHTPAAATNTIPITMAMIPAIHHVKSILAMTLTVSAVIHPAIIYGQFHTWNGVTPFATIPLFYQGVSESTAALMADMSEEGMSVLRELVKRYPDCIAFDDAVGVYDWLLRAYPDDITDTTSLHSALVTNKAYAGLVHPMKAYRSNGDGGSGNGGGSGVDGFVPDVGARYWTEDVPCHLLLAKGVAMLAEVPTPRLDTVLRWMQEQMGLRYLLDGAEEKLGGEDVCRSYAPQRFGLSLDELMTRR